MLLFQKGNLNVNYKHLTKRAKKRELPTQVGEIDSAQEHWHMHLTNYHNDQKDEHALDVQNEIDVQRDHQGGREERSVEDELGEHWK